MEPNLGTEKEVNWKCFRFYFGPTSAVEIFPDALFCGVVWVRQFSRSLCPIPSAPGKQLATPGLRPSLAT